MLSLLPLSLLLPWESCSGLWSVVVRGKVDSPWKFIWTSGHVVTLQRVIWLLPHGRCRVLDSSLAVTVTVVWSTQGTRRKAFCTLWLY